jgi:hypothetical protein
MELEKQRMAALNYCRQTMEAAETSSSSMNAGQKMLVPFNQPGVELDATLSVEFYPINSTTGAVDWSTSSPVAAANQASYCRVRATWKPTGTWSRTQMVSLASIIRAGTL